MISPGAIQPVMNQVIDHVTGIAGEHHDDVDTRASVAIGDRAAVRRRDALRGFESLQARPRAAERHPADAVQLERPFGNSRVSVG